MRTPIAKQYDDVTDWCIYLGDGFQAKGKPGKRSSTPSLLAPRFFAQWASRNEEAILARPLTKDEPREVTAIVRRLTALILLSDQLDANYAACLDAAYNWPLP